MLDIKAQGSVVLDMAEDGGISTIKNECEVFFEFVDVLCAMRARYFRFKVFCILLYNFIYINTQV